MNRRYTEDADPIAEGVGAMNVAALIVAAAGITILIVLCLVILLVWTNAGAQGMGDFGDHLFFLDAVYEDEEEDATTIGYYLSSGFQPNVSHAVMGLSECTVILDAGTYPGGIITADTVLTSGGQSPDPSTFPSYPNIDLTTGVEGIKWDGGVNAGAFVYVYVKIRGTGYGYGEIEGAIKAGQDIIVSTLQGPLTACDDPLPVSLSYFHATRDGAKVTVQWHTFGEVSENIRGYNVTKESFGGNVQVNDDEIAATGGWVSVYVETYTDDGEAFYLETCPADDICYSQGPYSVDQEYGDPLVSPSVYLPAVKN